MKRTLFLFALAASSACASTHRERAVQFVVASDAITDQTAEAWNGFVDARIAYCREQLSRSDNTPENRKECLGIAARGKDLEAAVSTLVAAQLAVKIAVECESNPLELPNEFRQECVSEKEADWRELASAIEAAWKKVREFYLAVRGNQ